MIHVFILLVLIFIPTGYAESPSNTPTLSFVSTEHAPLSYYDSEGQATGYAVEIIKAAMTDLNVPYQFQLSPWARSYHKATQQKNTCIFSLVRTPEREDKFKWVAIMGKDNAAFYSRASNKITVEKLADAKAYTVAAIREDAAHLFLLRNGFVENKNIYIVDGSDSLLNLLYKRPEIDLIISDTLSFYHRVKNAGLNPSAFRQHANVTEKPTIYYLACNKNTSDEIINKISNRFDKIHTNGTVNAFKKEWLGISN